jgi:hypothetical protein
MVCELDRAVGELIPCPGESCPFWADSRCVLAGLRSDWHANPSLAALLRDVRRELSLPGGRELVPPGLRD